MTGVCNPKKLRLGGSAAGASAAPGDGAARMLQELARKCSCAACSRLIAGGPVVAKCGHCLCGDCAEQLRGSGGVAAAAAAAAAADPVACGVCGQQIRGEELKRDYGTEKLLNAMKVLEAHIRSQESQPILERARCADCLGKAAAAGGDADDAAGGRNAASAVSAAAGRCEELRRRLEQLADDADKEEAERRRLLAAAAEELDAWQDRLKRQFAERHRAASDELGKIHQQAERLLTEEGARRGEVRAAAAELRHLLASASSSEDAESTLASLRSAEARTSDLLGRLSGCVGGSFELARRGDTDTLAAGFAVLLAQVGVDLVIRPYAAALGARSEPRPARTHRTGSLEPWDLALLTNVSGLWYTPDGEVKTTPTEGEPGADWLKLPSPCLIVNYKGFKTKRLHLFDTQLRELASVRLHLKDGRLPGTIYVCNQRQIVITVDHSRCKISQFDLTGRLLRKFGSSGIGSGQFRQPMTAFIHGDLLYVVDSDNKRVQMFNPETQEPNGEPLTHKGFSTDLHSVLVSDARIIVTDRDNSKAFVFDRQSRVLLREVDMGGKPFALTTDADGNVFVSLTNERKVKIYDAAMAHCLHTLNVIRRQRRAATGAAGSSDPAAAAVDDEEEEVEEEEDSSSSDGGGGAAGFSGLFGGLKLPGLGGSKGKPPFIYGIAFDPAGRRLFVADTFCHAILAYQL